jgi:hypothetical protein
VNRITARARFIKERWARAFINFDFPSIARIRNGFLKAGNIGDKQAKRSTACPLRLLLVCRGTHHLVDLQSGTPGAGSS